MKSITKALLYGLLTWAVPFVAAIPFYSRDGQLLIDIFLFKSIMIIVGFIIGAVLLLSYFKKVSKNYVKESLYLGLSWLLINWVLDFFILIPLSQMDFGTYFIQIGLRYLAIPIYSLTVGLALRNKETIK